jgi:hypothetical protein
MTEDQLQHEVLPCLVEAGNTYHHGADIAPGSARPERSDLDLVLRHPLDLTRDIAGWAELQTALQDSPLPMLVDAHQWLRLPDSFRTGVEEAHVVVQGGGL